MHDIKAIRADPAAFDAWLTRRGGQPQSTDLLQLDHKIRRARSAEELGQTAAKEAARAIGRAKASGDTALADSLLRQADLRENAIDKAFMEMGEQAARDLENILATLPNLPAPDVPDGLDESANVVVYTHGTPPAFDFAPREHDALALRFGYDPDAAANIAGARFAVLTGPLARLHRALGQFMLDVNVAAGWTEVAPPVPGNCRNSPTTPFRRPTGATSSRLPRCR